MRTPNIQSNPQQRAKRHKKCVLVNKKPKTFKAWSTGQCSWQISFVHSTLPAIHVLPTTRFFSKSAQVVNHVN